jgi:hypothetical protein
MGENRIDIALLLSIRFFSCYESIRDKTSLRALQLTSPPGGLIALFVRTVSFWRKKEDRVNPRAGPGL